MWSLDQMRPYTGEYRITVAWIWNINSIQSAQCKYHKKSTLSIKGGQMYCFKTQMAVTSRTAYRTRKTTVRVENSIIHAHVHVRTDCTSIVELILEVDCIIYMVAWDNYWKLQFSLPMNEKDTKTSMLYMYMSYVQILYVYYNTCTSTCTTSDFCRSL